MEDEINTFKEQPKSFTFTRVHEDSSKGKLLLEILKQLISCQKLMPRQMKKYKVYIIVIFALMLQSCNARLWNNNEGVRVGKEIYHPLLLKDAGDILEGYYKIRNDSFFYISKSDFSSYDSISCPKSPIEEARAPYLLFYKSMNTSLSIINNRCDRLKFRYENPFPLNYAFSSEELLSDRLEYIHISRTDTTQVPLKRKFIVDKDLEIIDFVSNGKTEHYYFYYD